MTPRTEAGKRLAARLNRTDNWRHDVGLPFILAIEAEATAAAEQRLRNAENALRTIADSGQGTPGAECLWCLDDLGAHRDGCPVNIARTALLDAPAPRETPENRALTEPELRAMFEATDSARLARER